MSSSGPVRGNPRVMYGVVIHDTINRGNQSELQSLLAEAKQTHLDQGDLAQAITQLEVALKRPGGIDPRPLYGVPAHDAIRRADRGELQTLLTHARATHEAQGDLKQVIADLENALKK